MENPYAAPQSVITLPNQSTEAEQIRNLHLSHEASVKSLGTLYFLGAILLSLALIGTMAPIIGAFSSGTAKGTPGGSELLLLIGIPLLLLALIILQFALAGGLRKLRPWVRIPVIVLSIIGLLGFPLGTIISGYILYLMLSAKSKMVFSPEYQRIIALTPHIRYRSSLLVTVLVVILVLAVLGGISAVWFRTR